MNVGFNEIHMRKFTILIVLSVFTQTLFAQSVRYDSGYSWRLNKLGHYYKMVSWDDSQYKEFSYRILDSTGKTTDFMNWRAIFPPGYDKNNPQKYPMILMLHGAGESGRSWSGRFSYSTTDVRYDNNGHNLLHGGEVHRNSVNLPSTNPRSFPGIVIFPQVKHSGSWESGWNTGILSANEKMAADIVEYMIANYSADINKIYLHGLSNGGKGTWDMSSKRPDLFAAILPMSGVARDTEIMTNIHVTTPVWLFQGGLDGNPTPKAAQQLIDVMKKKGANPRYTLYPQTGHGTWYEAYNEPDFFSWMLAQDKRRIYVFGGDTQFCAGASLRLGFSAGFSAYQWTLNGADIAGATTRYFDATQPGTYTVKFMRNDGQWYESFPVNTSTKPASTYSPAITNTGSVVLPIDISAKNVVDLVGPTGFTEYNWYKNGIKLATTTTNFRNIATNTGLATNAGDYTLQVKESTGCQSQVSNIIRVVYTSPHVGPTPPVLATPTVLSMTQTSLSWTDSPNEEYYEIWRSRSSLNGYVSESYKLVGKVDANTLTFSDAGLRPFAQYRYRIRAIGGNDGKFSTEKSITMPNDTVLPTAPTNVQVSTIVDLKATLSWVSSTDNDQVSLYEIFIGSTLAGTSTTTSYALVNLLPGTLYTVGVRAVDGRGNRSETTTITFNVPDSGVAYKYYETPVGLSNLATYDFTTVPTKSGVVNNFDISIRNRNDQFVFSFDGFIQIDEIGTYSFFTSSDDGSRLFIDGVMVVDNDGLHGTQERTGTYTFASTGRYPIRVIFFENGGGEVLQVSYDPPGTAAKQLIPSNKLFLIGNAGSSSARMREDEAIAESEIEEETSNKEDSYQVAVYPNPFTDRITVAKGSLQGKEIKVYNHTGLLIKLIEPSMVGDDATIELKDLPKGIYYLSIGETKVRLLKKD
jgi:predicted esterase